MSRLEKFSDAATEALWALTPPLRPPAGDPWPLDEARLAGVRVRWPLRYQWAPSAKWMNHLRLGIGTRVAIEPAEIAQPYPGIVVIEVVEQGRARAVAIDYSDYPTVNEECAGRVAVYFKMQHVAEGYPWPHVHPGGFVPAGDVIYRALPHLRARRERRPPDHDVYGRFGLGLGGDTRARAVELLSRQSSFGYEGSGRIIRYSRYLREIAGARICVDLPGNGDFCFRLVDYLAVGACVITLRPLNRLHVPLEHGVHVVHARRDLSDLVDLCEHYLAADEEREAIGRRGREFFDRYLHRDRLAAYYLSRCLDPGAASGQRADGERRSAARAG